MILKKKIEEKPSAYCFYCGARLSMDGQYDRGDVIGDDDGLVEEYHCSNCGATYEAYLTPFNNEEEYPYYKERYAKRKRIEQCGISRIDWYSDGRLVSPSEICDTLDVNGIRFSFGGNTEEAKSLYSYLKEMDVFAMNNITIEDDTVSVMITTGLMFLIGCILPRYGLDMDDFGDLSGISFSGPKMISY